MNTWRLLITRPAVDNQLLAAQLQQLGVFSFGLPLLDMRALEETPAQRSLMLNLDRYSSIVVVSKPAARYALERLDTYWPQPPSRPQWFSVGAATGQILKEYGLPVSWPEQGDDSEALLALAAFQDSLKQPNPRALIMRADVGRDFLSQQILDKGVPVDFLSLYERFLPEYPTNLLLESIQQNQLNGLVVSSEQGLKHLLELADIDWSKLARLPLFTPSPRVAQTARDLGATYVIDCQGASNDALIKALQQHRPSQS